MNKILEIARAAAKIFTPPPRLLVSEWADRERFLSAEASAEPGRWSTDRAPYQRAIMDAAKDPLIQKITVMTSAQVGKTEIILNLLGYFAHHDPAPILVVQPTLQMAESFSKDRLSTMIRDTPALRDIFGEERSRSSGNTLLHKKFPGGHITLAGSNSPASLASRPVRIVLFDEVDRYPGSAGTEGDPVSLGQKRTTTFFNRLVVLVSTPTIKGASRIEQSYEQSNQCRLHLPCPGCKALFKLEFPKLKWDAGKPETAHFICESCGLVIEHFNKKEMLAGGKWIADKPEIQDHFGVHLNELYSPWKTWGEVAEDFLKAKQNPETLKTFINTSLGETWEIQGDAPDWKRLYDRREDYKTNTLPAGVKFLTCGVDVQKNRFELEIVGWGDRLESWSIDYRVHLTDTSKPDAFAPLDQLLLELWKTAAGNDIPILRLAIDSGYEAVRVYQWARKYARSKVMVVKGVDELDRLFQVPRTGDKRTLMDKEGVPVWRVGVSTAKRELYGFLKQPIPSDEEISNFGYPHGFAHFPKEYGEDYFKMLTAEVEDIKMIRGFPRYIWVKRYDRNEALDCRNYARAAAASLGIDGTDPKTVVELENKSKVQAYQDPKELDQVKIKRKKSSILD